MLVGGANGDTFGGAWVGGRLGFKNGFEKEEDGCALDRTFCACREMSFRGGRQIEPSTPTTRAVLCNGVLIIFGGGIALVCERIGVDTAVRGRIMEAGGPIAGATTVALGLGIDLLADRNAACFCEKGFEDVNSGETPEHSNSILGRGVLCKIGGSDCCFGGDGRRLAGLAGVAGCGWCCGECATV